MKFVLLLLAASLCGPARAGEDAGILFKPNPRYDA